MNPKPPSPTDVSARRKELNREMRLAFLEGAEVEWRRSMGRGLSDEELVRVLRRYPGDLPGR